MSSFTSALATQELRQTAVAAYVQPMTNQAAQHSLIAAEKVNAFLAPYAKRANRIKGFTPLHPAFFHQLYSTLIALEYGASLARARGDGRLATTVDQVRSIGTGFGKSIGAIERFLKFDTDPAERRFISKRSLKATFPIADQLHRSSDVFMTLIEKLDARRVLIRDHEKHGTKLSKEDRDNKLIYGKWDEAKIIEYSIEYMARSFAIAMTDEVRHKLVTDGPEGFSLKQAMDTLKPKLLIAAA